MPATPRWNGRSLAQHLLAAGDGADAVSPAVREEVRRRLAARALGAMLHWSRGRFDFEERPVDGGRLSLSIDQLVLELVAAETRRVELARSLHDFHAVPDFAPPERLLGGGPVVLSTLDWRLLDAVDGVRDVGALAAALGEALEDVGERVQALEAATILVLRTAPANIAIEARAALEAGRYEARRGVAAGAGGRGTARRRSVAGAGARRGGRRTIRSGHRGVAGLADRRRHAHHRRPPR